MLLARLEPIFQVGLARALADGGAEVIDETNPNPDALVRQAAERGPDAIVLGDGAGAISNVGERLRAAAPGATLVLWRTGARVVAVLVPGAESPRVIPAPNADQLSNELFGSSAKGEICPST